MCGVVEAYRRLEVVAQGQPGQEQVRQASQELARQDSSVMALGQQSVQQVVEAQ